RTDLGNEVEITETRHEEAVRPRLGKGMRAFESFGQERPIVRVLARHETLEEQVGARVDPQTALDDGGHPLRLFLDRMEPFPADHLVLEVAADGTGLGQRARMFGEMRWIRSEAAFEVDRYRHVHSADDTSHAIEKQRERNALSIGKAVGFGQAMATGGDSLRARRRDRLGAAHVPDVVEQDRVTRLVERSETIAVFLVHFFPSRSSSARLMSSPYA